VKRKPRLLSPSPLSIARHSERSEENPVFAVAVAVAVAFAFAFAFAFDVAFAFGIELGFSPASSQPQTALPLCRRLQRSPKGEATDYCLCFFGLAPTAIIFLRFPPKKSMSSS